MGYEADLVDAARTWAGEGKASNFLKNDESLKTMESSKGSMDGKSWRGVASCIMGEIGAKVWDCYYCK